MDKHTEEFLIALNGMTGALAAWLEVNDESGVRAAMLGALNKLRHENASLRKDAERFRWLRDVKPSVPSNVWMGVEFGGVGLEGSIDAAMKDHK